MEVVIDSNLLFRTLISHGKIVTLFFDPKLELFAPKKLREEFIKNKEDILSKSKLSEEDFNELSSLLFEEITFVPLNEYKKLLPKAKSLLGSHSKDEDFIALCLLKDCKVWTYETLLFDVGLGISTKQVATELSLNNKE